MIGSIEFPRLTLINHRITSPASPDYNCVAWAAGDDRHWWQPGSFWPCEVSPDQFGVSALRAGFVELDYEDCGVNHELEVGFEKVALYGWAGFYTHAARQLPTGKWTSKLGRVWTLSMMRPMMSRVEFMATSSW